MQERRVALYHVVYANESFETAAQTIVSIIRNAQRLTPGQPRVLYLDIEGHRLADGAFDPGMLELQKQFAAQMLLPYVTEAVLPIGNLRNPEPQRDDVPDELVIRPLEGGV